MLVVLHGDHDRDCALKLQGSIKAGLAAAALAEEDVAAVMSVDLPSCRSTAEKIHERHADQPFHVVADTPKEWGRRLQRLAARFSGKTVVLVIDETGAHHLFSDLEGPEPDKAPRHPLTPAGITRITLRPNGGYSMRLDNTDHLDGITDSDRFRML